MAGEQRNLEVYGESDVASERADGDEGTFRKASAIERLGAGMILDDVDDASFGSRVFDSPEPTLVLFTSESCTLCELLARALPFLANDQRAILKIVRCPVETTPIAAELLRVSVTPTLVLLSGGEILGMRTGIQPLPELRNWLEQCLCGTDQTAVSAVPEKGALKPSAFLRAFFARSTALRGCKVAAVVAPVLLVVNHGELLLRDPFSLAVLRHLSLNLLVPFFVSSYSSAKAAVDDEGAAQE